MVSWKRNGVGKKSEREHTNACSHNRTDSVDLRPTFIVWLLLIATLGMQPVPCGAHAGPASTGEVSSAVGECVAQNTPSSDTNSGKTVRLNFEDADIRTVLTYLSELSGETIVPDPGVHGEVTVINPKPVTPEQAKEIIYAILETHGFTIVRYANLVKVVPSSEAQRKPIRTVQPVSKTDSVSNKEQ
jgi:hypothetical protein